MFHQPWNDERDDYISQKYNVITLNHAQYNKHNNIEIQNRILEFNDEWIRFTIFISCAKRFFFNLYKKYIFSKNKFNSEPLLYLPKVRLPKMKVLRGKRIYNFVLNVVHYHFWDNIARYLWIDSNHYSNRSRMWLMFRIGIPNVTKVLL